MLPVVEPIAELVCSFGGSFCELVLSVGSSVEVVCPVVGSV